MALHMMKLVVGPQNIAEFAAWQQARYSTLKGQKVSAVRTRYKPKQAEEIIASGGSIYRIIKGYMCCRQKIVGFENIDTEDGTKCLILTDLEIIRTYPTLRKPFQGWRYLKQENTPQDIGPYIKGEEEAPIDLEAELKALGLL